MPTVNTRYVTWTSRRRRHGGAAAADIVMPLSTAASSGGTYQAWAAPSASWTDGSGQHTAAFAFWSVTGAADGASYSTNPSLSVDVGATNVGATAWYLPGGGGGDGEGVPGATIDAFEVDQGTFVDDDFVDVVSDASLTAGANNDGFVPTGAAQDIRAYASIHAVPFREWVVALGAPTVANMNLHADAGTISIAFAFYMTSRRVINVPHEETWTWVSWGVKVDGGGLSGTGPVPPWNPLVRELAAGLALAETGRLLDRELQSTVFDAAAKQVTGSANAIARLMKRESVK
jgi:hypothetical protein